MGKFNFRDPNMLKSILRKEERLPNQKNPQNARSKTSNNTFSYVVHLKTSQVVKICMQIKIYSKRQISIGLILAHCPSSNTKNNNNNSLILIHWDLS